MKPISRFLCRCISVVFPVRLSTDDRRSYRVTSRRTHQASRLMIPEDQYSDMVPPPVLTSRDRTGARDVSDVTFGPGWPSATCFLSRWRIVARSFVFFSPLLLFLVLLEAEMVFGLTNDLTSRTTHAADLHQSKCQLASRAQLAGLSSPAGLSWPGSAQLACRAQLAGRAQLAASCWVLLWPNCMCVHWFVFEAKGSSS